MKTINMLIFHSVNVNGKRNFKLIIVNLLEVEYYSAMQAYVRLWKKKNWWCIIWWKHRFIFVNSFCLEIGHHAIDTALDQHHYYSCFSMHGDPLNKLQHQKQTNRHQIFIIVFLGTILFQYLIVLPLAITGVMKYKPNWCHISLLPWREHACMHVFFLWSACAVM